jgi:hypothetical protein
MTRRIDDRRMVGIQLLQSVDQGKSFGCAVHASLTHRMVPHQGCNVCIEEKRSDRRGAGIKGELRSSSQIKNAFFRVRGGCLGVQECPTTIKDRLPQFLRDIDRRQLCCAECRHEQNELEVRHFWVLDIERWHSHVLSGDMPDESTSVEQRGLELRCIGV